MSNEKTKTGEKFKISFILLTLITTNILFYYFNLYPNLEYYFTKYHLLQLWRYTTSCLCSNSLLNLFLNILIIITISILNEKKNGSIIFFFDIILKNITLNIITTLLFIFLNCLEVLFGSVFTFFLNYQKNLEISGFRFVLVVELFLILTDKKSFSQNILLNFGPGILFIILSVILFLNLHFLSALILGLIIYFNVLNFITFFEKKDFIYEIEKKLYPLSSFFYMKHEELIRSESENNKNYYNKDSDNEQESLNDIDNFVSTGDYNDDKDDFSNFVSTGDIDPEQGNKINLENLEKAKKNDTEKKNLEDLDKSVDYHDFVLKSQKKEKENQNLYEI